MIFVYILVSVLSGFSAIIGMGGAMGAAYYLVTTGDLLYLVAAALSALFSWLAINLTVHPRVLIAEREYRRELSSILQAAGRLPCEAGLLPAVIFPRCRHSLCRCRGLLFRRGLEHGIRKARV